MKALSGEEMATLARALWRMGCNLGLDPSGYGDRKMVQLLNEDPERRGVVDGCWQAFKTDVWLRLGAAAEGPEAVLSVEADASRIAKEASEKAYREYMDGHTRAAAGS